jgi:hypothetical protein
VDQVSPSKWVKEGKKKKTRTAIHLLVVDLEGKERLVQQLARVIKDETNLQRPVS